MKLLPISIASRLIITVLVLIAICGIGFGLVIQSLSSTETTLREESTEHIELLTINSVVSRQVFELTTRVKLLEQAFLYHESVLSEEGYNIDAQLQRMRDLSSDEIFTRKMDHFIEDFHRFLGNSLTLNRIIREIGTTDSALEKQIDQLDFVVSDSRLNQIINGSARQSSNNLNLVDLLRESFLTIGKMVGTIRNRITPETEKVVLIKVQKELDIFQMHLANLENSSTSVKKEKSKLRRLTLKYNAALRKMQANLEQRWQVMEALVHSQNELLSLVERTENDVQNNAIGLGKRLEADISESRLKILVIACFAIFSALILISRVVKTHIKEPLKQLSDGFQRLESSNLNQRIELGRRDEWSTIENAFNKMANRLEETYSQLSEEKKNFDYLAHHDPLTGLANRLLITERLERQIFEAEQALSPFVVLYLDVDQFKTINDSLGHTVGDKLLVDVSLMLNRIIAKEGKVARMGGDEFMILLPNTTIDDRGEEIAQRINRCVRKPYFFDDMTVFVSTSIGVCQYPEHGTTVDTLIRNADTAMYSAKRSGRDQYCIYTDNMTSEANELIELSSGLRHALKNDEFEVHFQPQVNITDGTLIGAEALIRWPHPELGYLNPGDFLGVAEKTGLIEEIDDWMFQRVVRYIEAWIAQGIWIDHLSISVNFSGRKFFSDNLVDQLCSQLIGLECKPEHLSLEVTERDMMSQYDVSSRTISRLRQCGFNISIDDFGTGNSSLSLLKNLDVDTIKLDKSFIQDIAVAKRDFAIVHSVMQLAKELNLEVIAEGVEVEEQVKKLEEIHCFWAQGFLFYRPLPVVQWQDVLKHHSQSDQ